MKDKYFRYFSRIFVYNFLIILSEIWSHVVEHKIGGEPIFCSDWERFNKQEISLYNRYDKSTTVGK